MKNLIREVSVYKTIEEEEKAVSDAIERARRLADKLNWKVWFRDGIFTLDGDTLKYTAILRRI